MSTTTAPAPAITGQDRAVYHPLRWLIPLALLHGLLYLTIVPPWQHYDEPTQFEYAWLIANLSHLPSRSDSDPALRREVADSMYRFRFYDPGQIPDLMKPEGPTLGENQRVHPPLYYILAALPLRLSSGLAIEQQLYAARGLSLCLYALTIVAAWRVASVVVPDEPTMQLAVPLLLLLTPTFADLMTAVNNDVLVNFCAVALLLGCALLIRDGLRPAPLVLASLALGTALGTKRTAVILIVIYLLALLWAWLRTPMRPWVVAGAMLGVALALAMSGLELGRADDGTTLLTIRPWLKQFDVSYLRLNLDAWVRSATSTAQAGDIYERLLVVGFTSFWVRFGWGHVMIGTWAEVSMAVICALCGVGLIIQGWRGRSQLPLWQERCIWLFLIAITLGALSMVGRLHPLPTNGTSPYIPTGRYIFTMMLPMIWLIALGWQGLLPARWKPAGPFLLLGIWLGLDLISWGVALSNYYYRFTL
ncbi:hypothetical protein K2Z83_24180 [Oscillochloris sp. ZM17-4]|uniref:hypothetical protein n=1 Tax=Oscillochloris sp. ZM17-4 TaxID=2866714 RepID=UPI001C732B98|nr:hypothetical protein [Oscillochloris sp. ZM17-4]MBX0330759.1 hypothetical protein [Oscillochloris sp. ZM17-4]